MKIFLSFQQSEYKYPIPAYDFWQRYIKNGIEEAGHQWVECPEVDWAFGLVPKAQSEQLIWKQETWDKTVNWLKKNPVDFFLGYLYPEQVDSSAVNEIQKAGIPCANFFCDNVRQFRKIPKEYEVFDLNWVPEHKAIKLYEKAGYPYINLPMPVWVSPADRVIKPENYDQITFLGSKDIQRHILLEAIVNLDPHLPLAIYGSGWGETVSKLNTTAQNYKLVNKLKHQFTFLKEQGAGAYINKIKLRNFSTESSEGLLSKYKGGHQFEEYKVLTAESKITVGINRYPSNHFPLHQPDTYSRLRDIEAPMLGACYLTEWTEGIENLYIPGQEIEVYSSAQDFVEKAKALLGDEMKRKKIKINGQKRSLNDHDIPTSINKIINKLNL